MLKTFKLLSTALIFLPFFVCAEIIELKTTGKFTYGPDTSERKACKLAEVRAKSEAIQKIYGEKFTSVQQVSCKEVNSEEDNSNCVYHSFMLNTVDGEILSSKLISEEVLSIGRLSQCIVELVITAKKDLEKNDPGFDFQVELNKTLFRSQEKLKISINPSAKMYLSIFAWYPQVDEEKITRIFPNKWDGDKYLKDSVQIPLESSNEEMILVFPDEIEYTIVDEILFFVATKNNVGWLKEYTSKDFKSRLSEVRKPDKRVHKLIYRIIK